jgi:serine/threonine-protein kinase
MNDFNEKSPEFRDLGSRINTFFSSENEELTEQEDKAGSPILHSLDESRYHFTDEQFLIEGGAKKIFKVYDSHADRYVAVANPLKYETQLEKEEFLREAQLTAKLQHPNILPIYEMGLNSEGVPYFVMRLLEGEELKNIIRERTAANPDYLARYDLDFLLSIFLRVCDAVIYAHSRGVLHLDLKPSNIMVGRYGLVTLFDWGLARVVGDDGSVQLDEGAECFDPNLLNNITYSGMLKGTPGYMAPEQIEDTGNVTALTEVYSLGAVLYFILTGTIPVKGGHAEEVISNTLDGAIIRPRFRRPTGNIPVSLGSVAMKALQRDPVNRYQSVQELHDEINRFRRGFATQAEKASMIKRSQLFMRRHNQIVSAVMLFGAVLTAVIAFFLVRVTAQRQQAVAARKEAIHNLELYKEETKVSSKLYGEVQTFFINSVHRGDIWNFQLMRNIVSEELGKSDLDDKYEKQLLQMKGFLHFVNEEFNAAVNALDRAGYDHKNNIYKRSLAFAEAKPDDSQLLTLEQFAELIALPYRNTTFRKNILSRCYERHMRRSDEVEPRAYLPVAIAMLNLTNDSLGWGDHVRLEERNGGFHLDLSGAPYTTLRLTGSRWGEGSSILFPLNLVSLNLSESDIREFHGLKLPESFREMVLLDVDFYDLDATVYWLGQIPMERIVISTGAIPKYQLNRLRSKFEVVEVPAGTTSP